MNGREGWSARADVGGALSGKASCLGLRGSPEEPGTLGLASVCLPGLWFERPSSRPLGFVGKWRVKRSNAGMLGGFEIKCVKTPAAPGIKRQPIDGAPAV